MWAPLTLQHVINLTKWENYYGGIYSLLTNKYKINKNVKKFFFSPEHVWMYTERRWTDKRRAWGSSSKTTKYTVWNWMDGDILIVLLIFNYLFKKIQVQCLFFIFFMTKCKDRMLITTWFLIKIKCLCKYSIYEIQINIIDLLRSEIYNHNQIFCLQSRCGWGRTWPEITFCQNEKKIISKLLSEDNIYTSQTITTWNSKRWASKIHNIYFTYTSKMVIIYKREKKLILEEKE